ncbi:hypothetical protein Leryth_008413 [Lithospermum erythrorhizon]|uniref:Uncharacterized protein n=1 Tax=Lithospermum erythrorhizon TaxID=34254 RepID=A0AAV3R7P2_LITER|nr:hypothetical protein Leryth_008413 [Lithospermum erythrorhizon]
MGNLMETCIQKPEGEQNQEHEDGKLEDVTEFKKEASNNNRRVKIVLTKVELEWLMLQLKENKGRGLEEVLEEIERGRGERSVVGWKPSLESIIECPEVQEMDW